MADAATQRTVWLDSRQQEKSGEMKVEKLIEVEVKNFGFGAVLTVNPCHPRPSGSLLRIHYRVPRQKKICHQLVLKYYPLLQWIFY